ncbi:hypothetical protein SASPL_137749 [Salvia splendens]|uniref:Uncharacterized protein n=1 Tax=Salvia splendens TaxID=180675 RepID=A0A8X8ZEC0_SALSN|nr:hypothetical protein SASPL_137749 [Salvia splendens]
MSPEHRSRQHRLFERLLEAWFLEETRLTAVDHRRVRMEEMGEKKPRRLAKGKAVADGESSGKRKSKNALWQLGFGGLLDFDVTSVPGTLAYWLLEHFDHLRCSLMLPNDVELEVDTKDVELVFGFPNGGIKTHWQNIIAHYIRQTHC